MKLPDLVVELLLRRPGTLLEDGGIVRDVWLAFAQTEKNEPQQVLLSPAPGVGSVELAAALHQALKTFKQNHPEDRAGGGLPGVAPLEAYVVAKLTFNELVRVVLPLTTWWQERRLDLLTRDEHRQLVRQVIGSRVQQLLDPGCVGVAMDRQQRDQLRRVGHLRGDNAKEVAQIETRLSDTAAVLALVGVLSATRRGKVKPPKARQANTPPAKLVEDVKSWLQKNAQKFLEALDEEMSDSEIAQMRAVASGVLGKDEGPIVSRVFENRKFTNSANDALAAVKADSAASLFKTSCKAIAWAIVDSGIDASHPAFIDQAEAEASARRKNAVAAADETRQPALVANAPAHKPVRIRSTYDFTMIERIRSLDNETAEIAEKTVKDLSQRPGGLKCKNDEAKRLLIDIATRMSKKQSAPWELVEPLIQLEPAQPADANDEPRLSTKHGTHVAGLLGGDWRDDSAGTVMQGVCPDIRLYDFRVIPGGKQDGDAITGVESAVIAALEFVQFLNKRGTQRGLVVHGVNLSLQIPFEPGRYGCGATPVCEACDQLTGSGVVVVTAAGNLGWRAREAKFGDYVHSSITDPGNARTVITVGSTHAGKPHTYGVSYFSSRGPTGDGRNKPDVVAPGEKISGPVPGGGLEEMDGTSMAAPIVSGVAAMLLARYPELIGHPERVKDIICRTATDLGRERYFQGHGLVDALRALQSV